MPEKFTLLAECHVDTTLARALVRGRRNMVEHILGVPNISKRLLTLAADSRSRVVGMVDWDGGSVLHFPGMVPFAPHPVAEVSFDTHGYRLYRRPDCPAHFLVVLPPACDNWLFQQAEAAGINLAEHKLPVTFPAFKAFTKKQISEDHPALVSLLKALRRQPSPAFQQLLAFMEQQLEAAGQPRW